MHAPVSITEARAAVRIQNRKGLFSRWFLRFIPATMITNDERRCDRCVNTHKERDRVDGDTR